MCFITYPYYLNSNIEIHKSAIFLPLTTNFAYLNSNIEIHKSVLVIKKIV